MKQLINRIWDCYKNASDKAIGTVVGMVEQNEKVLFFVIDTWWLSQVGKGLIKQEVRAFRKHYVDTLQGYRRNLRTWKGQ